MQRRHLAADSLRQSRDSPELGVHAGRDDDAQAPPVRDDRPHPCHAAARGQRRRIGNRRDLLAHRVGLAGQCGFVRLHVYRFDEPQVRGDLIADFEPNEIARHHVPGIDVTFMAVANDRAARRQQPLQRFARAFGPPFLGETQDAVQDHDGKNCGRVAGLADRQGNCRRHEEDRDQRAGELTEKDLMPAETRGGSHAVRSVRLQAAGGFGLAQPKCRIDHEARHDGGLRKRMPIGPLGAGGIGRSVTPPIDHGVTRPAHRSRKASIARCSGGEPWETGGQ